MSGEGARYPCTKQASNCYSDGFIIRPLRKIKGALYFITLWWDDMGVDHGRFLRDIRKIYFQVR
jgi:hypothetical protein